MEVNFEEDFLIFKFGGPEFCSMNSISTPDCFPSPKCVGSSSFSIRTPTLFSQQTATRFLNASPTMRGRIPPPFLCADELAFPSLCGLREVVLLGSWCDVMGSPQVPFSLRCRVHEGSVRNHLAHPVSHCRSFKIYPPSEHSL